MELKFVGCLLKKKLRFLFSFWKTQTNSLICSKMPQLNFCSCFSSLSLVNFLQFVHLISGFQNNFQNHSQLLEQFSRSQAAFGTIESQVAFGTISMIRGIFWNNF